MEIDGFNKTLAHVFQASSINGPFGMGKKEGAYIYAYVFLFFCVASDLALWK
jgi:hypothetical protein